MYLSVNITDATRLAVGILRINDC